MYDGEVDDTGEECAPALLLFSFFLVFFVLLYFFLSFFFIFLYRGRLGTGPWGFA